MTEPLPTIVGVAYNAALSTLYVTFEEHGTFTYYAVPSEAHQALIAGRDRDRFFRDEIADHYFSWKTEPLREAG